MTDYGMQAGNAGKVIWVTWKASMCLAFTSQLTLGAPQRLISTNLLMPSRQVMVHAHYCNTTTGTLLIKVGA